MHAEVRNARTLLQVPGLTPGHAAWCMVGWLAGWPAGQLAGGSVAHELLKWLLGQLGALPPVLEPVGDCS